MNLRYDQPTKIIDVFRLGADDDVVGSGYVISLGDTGNLRDGGRDVGGLSNFGLNENVRLHHVALPCPAGVVIVRPRYRRRHPRAQEAAITIAELGEFGLIAAIARQLPNNADVILGVGDDAAVLRAGDGRVVATTDMLIEGRHFRRDWSGPADIGHKAAARNLADIAAMGARPTALLVGFAGPPDTATDWVLELVDGIARECAMVGAAVAGGDTSSADSITLAVTALGDLGERDPVMRSGARPGDVVAVAGTLGSAAAGLALLAAGATPPEVGGDDAGAAADCSVEDVAGALGHLISAHRRPRPPYAAGPEAAAHGATAMIDVSDGLMADLGHVAEASGVRIELDSTLIIAEPVARADALRAAATTLRGMAAKSSDLQNWVLAGGDDHALVATFPRAAPLPERWTVIGTVTCGQGVLVDGHPWNSGGGWEHFRA